MSLTLEVVGPKAAQMGESARKVFQAGGTIGRLRDNDWVFSDEYISGHHARIIFADDCFFIEDLSTNGIFIDSRENRLARGQRHLLRNGDTIYIDDYEIRVTIASDAFRIDPAAGSSLSGPTEADPLKLLGLQDARAVPPGPSAAALASQSPLVQHYRPPAASPPRPAAPLDWDIPDGCDPLAADEPAHPRAPPRPVPGAPARPSRAQAGPARLPSAPPSNRPAPPQAASARILADTSRVQMTVFGPSQVLRRHPLFLQTMFHLLDESANALALARIVAPNATIAQVLPLPGKIRDGDLITVRLLTDSRVNVDESTQSLMWRGTTLAAQFSIQLPWIDWRSEYLFTIEVDLDGCPVGRCKFRLSVGKSSVTGEATRAYGSLSRYQRAFVSYASEDRSIVADVAQLLEIQGIDYFLDQISQRVGTDWRTEIEKNIESADLFLLCWSRHAATSTWVAKEIEWALRTQRRTGGRQPDIRPFVLEGPPIAPPPRALRHLHFNSATRLLKQATGRS